MSDARVRFDFSGCRVLVTGGTSGIGEAWFKPSSAFCQDDAILKIARPCWTATIRLVVKLRPSRIRSTS